MEWWGKLRPFRGLDTTALSAKEHAGQVPRGDCDSNMKSLSFLHIFYQSMAPSLFPPFLIQSETRQNCTADRLYQSPRRQAPAGGKERAYRTKTGGAKEESERAGGGAFPPSVERVVLLGTARSCMKRPFLRRRCWGATVPANVSLHIPTGWKQNSRQKSASALCISLCFSAHVVLANSTVVPSKLCFFLPFTFRV